jgi:hypothetical protein
MTYQLDITGNKFDFVDFSEAYAYVNLIPKLEPQIELHFWGITLLTSQLWGEPLRLSGIEVNSNDDIYIAGYAMAIFREVVGSELKVTLYDPNSSDSFLKDYNNQPVTLHKRWGFKSADFRYELDCVSEWPSGACYLALASNGLAQLTFEVSDCVQAQQFVLNPNKYSQPGWRKDIQTHPNREYNLYQPTIHPSWV